MPDSVVADLIRMGRIVARTDLGTQARASDPVGRSEPGDLLDDSLWLSVQLEEVRLLAVACERLRSTPWQVIGDRLGMSAVYAEERYGRLLNELLDDLSFMVDMEAQRRSRIGDARPRGRPDGDGVDGPRDPTGKEHSPAQPGSVLFAGATLPGGVRESARLLLLEQELRISGALLRHENNRLVRAELIRRVLRLTEEIADIHRREIAPRVTVHPDSEHRARVTFDNRAVAVLERLDPADVGAERAGWYLWAILNADAREPADDAILTEHGTTPQQARADAHIDVAEWIAHDLRGGVGPFDPGGIAGPPASEPPPRAELARELGRSVTRIHAKYRQQVAPRLTVHPDGSHRARITFDDRPVAMLGRLDPAEVGAERAGSYVWVIADADTCEPGASLSKFEFDATPQRARADAHNTIVDRIAADMFRGVGPFDAGGIAGPPRRDTSS